MDLLLKLEPTSSRRAQLERQLRDGIRSGRLRPGAALPPSRALAAQLGVSRGVVVDAYSQLVAEGYLTARTGSGTRVADTIGAQAARPRAAVERAPAIRYDLRSGLPDVSSFPRKTWQAATARAMRELPDAWLLYGRPRGFSGLRVALTDYLARSRATVADPSRILVCTGISHGMTMLWSRIARARGPAHRRRGPRLAVPGRERALRGTRPGADPGGRARPGRVGARRRRGRRRGRDAEPPLSDRCGHGARAPLRARSVGAPPGRADRRGRLRRRVPLRPRSGRRPAGPRSGSRGLRGHRQQDARSRPAPGVARHALLAGRRRDRPAAGAQGERRPWSTRPRSPT